MNPVITQPIPGRRERPSLLVSDVARFLEILWQPGDVREVRIPQHNEWRHTASGYFDSPAKLAEAVSAWDSKANVYLTLNPVDRALLSRATNRIVPRATNTTSDVDILARRFLFLDIDSIRPAGISATVKELEGARQLLVGLTSGLALQGWPEPATCMSGNGHYALYPIDLPNTPDVRQLLERVLKALATRYDTQAAKIDTAVANAARILGLIGTMKVKGDATEDRPHRRSSLLTLPSTLEPVPPALLEELAGALSSRPIPKNHPGGGQARPLRELLDEADHDYREQPSDSQGTVWYHVRRCPFHGEDHPYECGVGQAPNGAYAGKCFHDESKGWREWKRALSLGASRAPSPNGRATGEEPPADGPRFPRTDAGNGELFAYLYRDQVRYDHRRSKWLIWGAHHWREDIDGQVRRLAIGAARHRYRQAECLEDLSDRQLEARFAVQSENRQRLDAMLGEAKCLPPIAADGEHWDEDPWMLGVANGVVDLRTGTLRTGRPEDLITCYTDVPFDPEARCPRWCQFLEEVFRLDAELIDFVSRVAGYSLTGVTVEQCLFLCHGRGANGKSIFLAILRTLLGLYAYNAPFSTFELRARSEISNDVAALVGRRLVTASETNDSTRLNEARVKALTGSDTLTARFMYGENFSFTPVAKFFLATNHLPVVQDDSYGFWRRVRLIPFLRQFTTDADPDLLEKLTGELPGILAWAVRGCLAWQTQGLTPPACVLAATEDYRQTSDVLAEFVTHLLVLEEERSLGATEAFASYQTWAREQGMTEREMLTSTLFGRKMSERFLHKKTNKGKRYLGVGLPGDAVQEVLR